MKQITRSWLSKILLNTTKNIVQKLDSIIHQINHFYPVKNTINFAKINKLHDDFSDGKILICQQLGPNLESAPQYHIHNRFQPIAYLHPPFYKLTSQTH